MAQRAASSAGHLTLVAPRKRYDAQRDGCFDRKKENCGWSVAAASDRPIRSLSALARSRAFSDITVSKMGRKPAGSSSIG